VFVLEFEIRLAQICVHSLAMHMVVERFNAILFVCSYLMEEMIMEIVDYVTKPINFNTKKFGTVT
jgi:hypothetical protein